SSTVARRKSGPCLASSIGRGARMQEVGPIVYWLMLLVAWIAIPFGAPGALIMLALSLLYGWLTGFREPGGHALIWIAAVSLPAEAADQLLGIWAARRYGATFRGILGAVAGGIAGSLLLSPIVPIIGTIAGALGGGFAGAYVVEWMVQRDSRRALRAA